MLTGTPLDLTPYGSVLRAVGLLYWVAMLGCAAVALWWPRRWWWKGLLTIAVLAGFIYPVAHSAKDKHERQDAAKVKLAEAMQRFQADCKNAGEKISRVVENVDGVVWMKWREPITNVGNFAQQFKLNDPYGQDCGGEDCIKRLLRATEGLELDPQRKLPYHRGYRFVESVDPKDDKPYRYTLRLCRPADRDPKYLKTLIEAELLKEPIDSISARYGVTWDDVSTHEDREKWIAGSSLKVIDLKTKEVIAERVGYMVDKGQGSQEGFRSPWLYAEFTACPAFERSQSNSPIKISRTTNFIKRVLVPTQGEK